jgi:hypothetical protein
MTRIQDADQQAVRELERSVQKATRGCASLEEAAQKYTSLLCETFDESVVLARVFATSRYSDLPESHRRYVDDLARSAGVSERVGPDMLTLSLLGTSGVEADWNDRRRSRGHVAIPLVSSAFIDAIPMMARLLHELGLGFDWLDSGDTESVLKTLGSINGVFHVADAGTALDTKGRNIIPARDFVEKYHVRSVFGVGGAYVGTPTFIVVIVFCRDEVSRDRAEQFMTHINRIKTSTMELARQGKLFAG